MTQATMFSTNTLDEKEQKLFGVGKGSHRIVNERQIMDAATGRDGIVRSIAVIRPLTNSRRAILYAHGLPVSLKHNLVVLRLTVKFVESANGPDSPSDRVELCPWSIFDTCLGHREGLRLAFAATGQVRMSEIGKAR